MLNQFRLHYPQGSLTSELVMIDHGLYIVRSRIEVGDMTLATGLAAATTVEDAEDQARLRALALLNFETSISSEIQSAPIVPDTAHKTVIASQSLTPKEKLVEESQLSPIPKSVKTKKASASTPTLPVAIETVAVKTEKSSPISLPEIPPLSEPSPVTQSAITEKASELILSEPVEAEIKPLPEELVEIPPTPQALTEQNGKSPILELVETNGEIESALPLETLPLLDNVIVSHVSQSPEMTVDQPAPSALDTSEPIDFSEVIARSNVELKRLNWTQENGKNYLLQTYGKRSRQLLSDEELIEFLQYLESQPTPPSA
jgi:hypothetical protein